MTQKCPVEIRAGVAGAILVERQGAVRVAGVLDANLPLRSKRKPIAAIGEAAL